MLEGTSRSLQVIGRGDEIRRQVLAARQAGQTVGLAPTMGALHEGHLSLVDAARRECDAVAASIFVNPTQFGPQEDFTKYPRPLERDLELLESHGCRWVFAPEPAEMYPAGFETYIEVGSAAEPWEGALRPGHFRGVATVVHKLFQLIPADRAYFGQKDYQQTVVVRRMAADLNLPIEIRVCPTVRDADGLALSSRNVYLSAEERRRALALSQSLELAASAFAQGEKRVATLRGMMLAHIAAVAGVEPQYIAFMPDGTVRPTESIDGPTVIAVAAKIGGTRLIDNCRIG